MPRSLSGVKPKKSNLQTSGEPCEIRTRYIDVPTQTILWGRAAGRCEFSGCNKALWKSPVTQEPVNLGQKAHIYSFSSQGPRGNLGAAKGELNRHDNLMLVCPECHLKIDDAPDGGRYTVAVLQRMKVEHESRVEIVTGIGPQLRSHVLMYGANIGEHPSPRLLSEAAEAMFPRRFPAESTPLSLGMVDSSFRDRNNEFWQIEAANLRTQFNQRVRDRFAAGKIEHISVFALAPQPLLILLGTFLCDITPADVYQRHREPPTWSWPESIRTPEFQVERVTNTNGPAALVLALSATVTLDRISAVLGPDASIWVITVPSPHNDLTKSPDQLSRFRILVREQLDRIKACHGQNSTLHVFPAASAAFAVEFGRIRMPKADMPWHLYDQVNARGGFVHALSIPFGD